MVAKATAKVVVSMDVILAVIEHVWMIALEHVNIHVTTKQVNNELYDAVGLLFFNPTAFHLGD